MQLTGTIKKKQTGKNEQVLDKLKVERERGITGPWIVSSYDAPILISGVVKAQTARYVLLFRFTEV